MTYFFYMECAQETLLVALYLAGLVLCIRNRRASRCTWLVLAGFAALAAATPLNQLVWQVLRFVSARHGLMDDNAWHVMQVVVLVQSIGKVVGMGLVVTGLGLVLIDLGRRVNGRLRESKTLNQPPLSGTEVGMS